MALNDRVRRLENPRGAKLIPPCICPDKATLDSMTKVSPEEANRIYKQFIDCGAHGRNQPPSRHGAKNLQMTPEEAEEYYHEFITMARGYAPDS